ncbi:DUF6804 family protein [Prosthecobacter dejongeii]|uniref:Uncharacterized protein n=1 Tax=Prosthecobacter dejongeii TaxID=48465 RepID=A0A7W7YMA0_9BACT|nr:DUF6804 family protein [Prosthecobacter dejongeii]MBB5038831.1 hypothetical protein [Prosthecobacter dejongeii]
MSLALPYLMSASLCLVALLPGLPYGYFMLVRWVVCVVAGYGAVQFFKAKSEAWAWGCLGLALLFNPIFKIHLGRELWWWADLGAAVFLGVVAKQSGGR